ncbi:MAG TPA: hypothetical protein VGM09_04605 [Bradyrhizobium sp.]|jgi:hypothetical protein
MFDPAKRLISRTKSMRSAAVKVQSAMRRSARIYNDINAYLVALTFGLAVLDGTVFAATRLPLLASASEMFSDVPVTAGSPVSNASDPVPQDPCGTPFSCPADW